MHELINTENAVQLEKNAYFRKGDGGAVGQYAEVKIL
jgi:hypothetical protein